MTDWTSYFCLGGLSVSFFGYCRVCDGYCTFETYGDILRCTSCGLEAPYGENPPYMIAAAQAQINRDGAKGTVNLAPVLLKASSASNGLEALKGAMPKDIAGYTELF